ncbi:MAG: 2-amino-4-hydroxy-6-hydroxymethyldihydropteridine diphosphokinase [Cyanobacteria bacterium REEB67]|nr:2-amino-4-hydroxy-6-hydroxymethyldihydropteridine diphosphokinase [Cyanobacteria bacterium REEB67]
MNMRAYIALGSNIGDPRKNVEQAIAHLGNLGVLTARSSLYATKPWGVTNQPDFCNAVVQLETMQSPFELLRSLQAIENQMGRTQTYKWGPRLIDLDLLTYGDLTINDPLLTVPHPHMNERAFVLVPLAEIDAKYAATRDLLPQADLNGISVLA